MVCFRHPRVLGMYSREVYLFLKRKKGSAVSRKKKGDAVSGGDDWHFGGASPTRRNCKIARHAAWDDMHGVGDARLIR